ncbi:MAG: hypothetical protein ACYC6Y_20725, partial [Thermoguttaceae bacterium]
MIARKIGSRCLLRDCALLLALLVAAAPSARAEAPRALAPGETPADVRLGDLKTLNGYFPFAPPAT